MKDFKQIDACDVIPHLTERKEIYACVLRSRHFNETIHDLSQVSVGKIVNLIEEQNVVFFERVEG